MGVVTACAARSNNLLKLTVTPLACASVAPAA
jgi:hypothetical protein